MKPFLILFSFFFLISCSKNDPIEIDYSKSVDVGENDWNGLEPEKKENKNSMDEKIDSPLSPSTGLPYEGASNPFFSVMIENSPNARPQAGLSYADFVFEIETEAYISRYLAFYHDTLPEKIGPVRSSRHYFVPLAASSNFAYIHFGGSPDAYNLLENFPHDKIDGIYNNTVFYRDDSRVAPHNAYLNTKKLSISDLDGKNSFWQYGEIAPSDIKTSEISLSYNSFTDIKYTYDDKNNKYLRFQEEEAHIDSINNVQIDVDNVVILFAKHNRHTDKGKGRIDVDLHSNGDLFYFTNGYQYQGSWNNDTGSLVFYDQSGKKLQLNKGKTWIQVLDENSSFDTINN